VVRIRRLRGKSINWVFIEKKIGNDLAEKFPENDVTHNG
jgi:hypothetical protein